MSEIVIEGLNMKAVNSLIWASAILAKVGVIMIGVYCVIAICTIIISILD